MPRHRRGAADTYNLLVRITAFIDTHHDYLIPGKTPVGHLKADCAACVLLAELPDDILYHAAIKNIDNDYRPG